MSGFSADLQSIKSGCSHICLPLFVMFSYVSQSFLSSTGLCSSYHSDHSHPGMHGVVAEVIVVVVVGSVVVGGLVDETVDTVVVVGDSVVVVD